MVSSFMEILVSPKFSKKTSPYKDEIDFCYINDIKIEGDETAILTDFWAKLDIAHKNEEVISGYRPLGFSLPYARVRSKINDVNVPEWVSYAIANPKKRFLAVNKVFDAESLLCRESYTPGAIVYDEESPVIFGFPCYEPKKSVYPMVFQHILYSAGFINCGIPFDKNIEKEVNVVKKVLPIKLKSKTSGSMWFSWITAPIKNEDGFAGNFEWNGVQSKRRDRLYIDGRFNANVNKIVGYVFEGEHTKIYRGEEKDVISKGIALLKGKTNIFVEDKVGFRNLSLYAAARNGIAINQEFFAWNVREWLKDITDVMAPNRYDEALFEWRKYGISSNIFQQEISHIEPVFYAGHEDDELLALARSFQRFIQNSPYV